MSFQNWTCLYWQRPQRPSSATLVQVTKQEGTSTSLLSLPRELRDLCFEFAIVSGYHQGEVWLDAPSGDLPYAPPALLSTCRQVRAEASKTYFTKTKFLFEDLSNCKRWLRSLDSVTRSYIRHLGYCSRFQEDDADPLGEKTAEECLTEVQAYLDAAGFDVKSALRVCNGCSYRFRHQWIAWAGNTGSA